MPPRTCCRQPAYVFATTSRRLGRTGTGVDGGSTCAHWRSRNAAHGLTTSSRALGRLRPMNDIARASLSTTDDMRSDPTRTRTVQSQSRRVSVPARTGDNHRISLTWRRLDQLAAAATLGIVLVSPQTALLTARMLGPRIPASGRARSSPDAATRQRGMGR